MKVNKFKFWGAMIFMTIFMDVVPLLGFLNIGSISITNMHIPAILTSIVLGPVWGASVGLIFGIISLARAVSRESAILDILLQNPLTSVLPRILFPLVTGYLYRILSRQFHTDFPYVTAALCAAAGAVTNSFFVLSSLFIFYPYELAGIFGLADTSNLYGSLLTAFLPNALIESFTAILAAIAVTSLLQNSEKT